MSDQHVNLAFWGLQRICLGPPEPPQTVFCSSPPRHRACESDCAIVFLPCRVSQFSFVRMRIHSFSLHQPSLWRMAVWSAHRSRLASCRARASLSLINREVLERRPPEPPSPVALARERSSHFAAILVDCTNAPRSLCLIWKCLLWLWLRRAHHLATSERASSSTLRCASLPTTPET